MLMRISHELCHSQSSEIQNAAWTITMSLFWSWVYLFDPNVTFTQLVFHVSPKIRRKIESSVKSKVSDEEPHFDRKTVWGTLAKGLKWNSTDVTSGKEIKNNGFYLIFKLPLHFHWLPLNMESMQYIVVPLIAFPKLNWTGVCGHVKLENSSSSTIAEQSKPWHEISPSSFLILTFLGQVISTKV